MPRTKGSRNKPMLTIEEQISRTKAEIAALERRAKEKRVELNELIDRKDDADMQRLMDMIVANGKSVDEVITMLNEATNHG